MQIYVVCFWFRTDWVVLSEQVYIGWHSAAAAMWGEIRRRGTDADGVFYTVRQLQFRSAEQRKHISSVTEGAVSRN